MACVVIMRKKSIHRLCALVYMRTVYMPCVVIMGKTYTPFAAGKPDQNQKCRRQALVWQANRPNPGYQDLCPNRADPGYQDRSVPKSTGSWLPGSVPKSTRSWLPRSVPQSTGSWLPGSVPKSTGSWLPRHCATFA